MHWLFSVCGLETTAAVLGAISMSVSVAAHGLSEVADLVLQVCESSLQNKNLSLLLPSPGCSSVTASTLFYGVCLISSGHKAVVKGVCAEMCAEMTLLCSQPPVEHCHVRNGGMSRENFSLSFCHLSKVRALSLPFFFFFVFSPIVR